MSQVDVLKLRDTINNLIDKELAKRNLTAQYAIVKGTVDHNSNKVTVLINGVEDDPDNYVSINMNTVQPTGEGDIIRVGGSGSDQYVEEVITPNRTYFMAGTVNVTNDLKATALPTTTNAANVNYDAVTGLLARVTSMPEFKLDAQPIEPDFAILDIPAYSWIDKTDHERDPGNTRRVVGVMAPDWQDIEGVAQYIEKQLVGVSYPAIVAHLLRIMSHMARDIKVLKSEVLALAKPQSDDMLAEKDNAQ